jgi:hypothetical protein
VRPSGLLRGVPRSARACMSALLWWGVLLGITSRVGSRSTVSATAAALAPAALGQAPAPAGHLVSHVFASLGYVPEGVKFIGRKRRRERAVLPPSRPRRPPTRRLVPTSILPSCVRRSPWSKCCATWVSSNISKAERRSSTAAVHSTKATVGAAPNRGCTDRPLKAKTDKKPY